MTDWNRLLAAAPLDKKAAVVANAKAKDVFDARYSGLRSDVPLPTQKTPQNVPDLSGQRFGRLIVIGMFAPEIRSQARVRWVVRCTCGYYEVRRHRTLRDKGDTAMCAGCERLERVKAATAQRAAKRRAA